MIGKVFNRVRTIITSVWNLSGFILGGRSPSSAGVKAYFDIGDPAFERYLFGLLTLFQLGGYRPCVRFRPGLFFNLRNYSDRIFGIPGMTIVLRPPHGAAVKVTDKPLNDAEHGTVFLSPDIFGARSDTSGFALPFTMHPLIYERRLFEEIPDLRKKRREVSVFFYASDLDQYRNRRMEELFGKTDRAKVAEVVRNLANEESGESPRSEAKRLRFTEDEKVPFEEWLPLMASADFFVAAPGVLMPYSHNLIEAMAVGTIPIVEYPELFSPALLDGVNCLKYEGASDLEKVLRRALNMEEDEVEKLKRGATEYYDEFLDPKRVVGRLMQNLSGIHTLYMIAGHLSVKAYLDQERRKGD